MATAADVMDDAAVKVNDASKSTYSYTVQQPLVAMANRELQILLELNGIPLLKERSIVITVEAGDTELDSYPADFIEPIHLEERHLGSTNEADFVAMTEKDWEPNVAPTSVLRYWTFRDNKIYFVGVTEDREVRLKYRRTLTPLTTSGAALEIADAQTWLAERVAQMIENDIMNSPTKAAMRNPAVLSAESKLISKLLKNTQGLGSRRRPYRGASGRGVR